MKVTRGKDQASASLDEFYTEMSNGESVREGGKAMIDLIDHLKALQDDRQVWGLTSHYRLCLLAEDDYRTPWYVIVGAIDRRNFYIEYLMPTHSAPWSNAYVKGEAQNVDQAVEMILLAMEKSEGWSKHR